LYLRMHAQGRARLAVSSSRWAARPARRILGLGAPVERGPAAALRTSKRHKSRERRARGRGIEPCTPLKDSCNRKLRTSENSGMTIWCTREGRFQRPMQPPTAGGLSWWLWPLRGGHGRGLRRFAAVVAEVFAPSWWSRRRSFIHRHKNNAKNRFTCDFRLFHHMNLLGVCASSRHLRRQAIFSAKS
jgi:hypothetical protein